MTLNLNARTSEREVRQQNLMQACNIVIATGLVAEKWSRMKEERL
jgi:hypothetical protein